MGRVIFPPAFISPFKAFFSSSSLNLSDLTHPLHGLALLFHFPCSNASTLTFFMNHICANFFCFFSVAEGLWCQQPVIQWEHGSAQRLWPRSGGHGAAAAEERRWQQPQELPQWHPCDGGQEQESERGDEIQEIPFLLYFYLFYDCEKKKLPNWLWVTSLWLSKLSIAVILWWEIPTICYFSYVRMNANNCTIYLTQLWLG